MTLLDDGRIVYRVRHPYGPGGTHRVMTPLEFLARLAAIAPPPRYPLLRYYGVLAPASKWRAAVACRDRRRTMRIASSRRRASP